MLAIGTWTLLAALPEAHAQAQRAASPRLPAASDLRADGARAQRDRTPILLFFSRDDCPHCKRVLREFLGPMAGDGPWQSKVTFRQVEIDRDLPLIDFAGTRTSHQAFASRWQVRFTPTVVVVGPDGRALAEPLVGLLLPDFYGAYLERAIEEGLAALSGAAAGS